MKESSASGGYCALLLGGADSALFWYLFVEHWYFKSMFKLM